MTRFDDRVETAGTVGQARSRGAVYTVTSCTVHITPQAPCIQRIRGDSTSNHVMGLVFEHQRRLLRLGVIPKRAVYLYCCVRPCLKLCCQNKNGLDCW